MSLCCLALFAMSVPFFSAQNPEYASENEATLWRLDQGNKRFVVVTDPRELPVKRLDKIPARWLKRTKEDQGQFVGTARPGEFFVFQVSVFNNSMQPITIHTVDMSLGSNATQTVCFNQAVSIDPGRKIAVPPLRIQPLWIGMEAREAGTVKGEIGITVSLSESGAFQAVKVPVHIDVKGAPLPDEGVDEGWRLARLKWLLPSGLGQGFEPTKGFRRVVRRGNRIDLTSTSLTLDASGLPAQIESAGANPIELLKEPCRFVVMGESGQVKWSAPETQFAPARNDQASWTTVRRCEDAKLTCEGQVDFDGFLRYRVVLEAKRTLKLSDVRLEAPYREQTARFQLGLGFHGGYTPESTDWKWNLAYQQDCVWLGDVPVGAQWRFKGANYQRPLVNIYYGFQPLNLPDSWGNSGLGGVKIAPKSGGIRLLISHSGPRILPAGEELEFNFDVQITPSRPINTNAQWSTRYYHPNGISPSAPIEQPVTTAREDGANVINIHHRTQINPFINYPFNDFSVPDLKNFVDAAHAEHIRVKLYYTTRELTWQMPEIWALKSFGESIIEPGPGAATRTVLHENGPDPRLTNALKDDFIPAWATDLDGKYAGKADLSVITRPDSAWTNFYLHGLTWLVKNAHIDGMYIDDTALDRVSLQRARRILEAGRPAPLIDLHSWNHENPLAASGSSTSIYMELFPYVDRIWFGEGFDYKHATPDYWLVAMSGIPYGVMSEMLQDGGNVWRGMLFGETCRLGWSGDPRSMWKFWDSFGMANTHMIGWWDAACPVRTDSPDVLATVYVKSGKTLIALANWSDSDRDVNLQIDWKALGLSGDKAVLLASSIDGFQGGRSWGVGDSVRVPGGKGWLIVVK